MTSNFQLNRLGDLLEVTSSKRIHMADYVVSGIPFYRSKEIIELSKGNRITTELFIEPSKFEKIKKNFGSPSKGDILLTSVGTLGVPYIVGDGDDFYFKDGNLTWMRNFSEKLSPKFLYYWLTSPTTQRKLDEISIGSTQRALTISALKTLEIPLPSIDTQNSIVEILNSLSEYISLLRETNITLEAIALALFKSWFVDFDPVRSKSEGKFPDGMGETTAALFPDAFKETELGMVPKGWVVDFFGNWIDVLETGRRPKGGVSGIDSGIPSIGAESVTRIGEFDYSKLKFVPSDFFAKMKTGKLQSKDVLLYKDGGKPGIFLPRVSMFGDGFPFDVCGINEHVFRLRIKKPLGQTFLYFWLWSDSVMHELKHRGGKAAIPGINQSDVKELKIAVPEGKTATKFEEITSPLVSKILANAKSINSLSNLRDTLLPRLISGQLLIADAATELEKVTA